ncbi:hypothetical protein BDP27DRAFT_1322377 [Rhodocollybia butyracea]|uniref:Nephrocystin 3-like N-terminal domain-containing protein n=1 Tax=Rhodocollybia butyracea TaxID=206335 RepID=A0A9P5U9V4_9AGAR|nr:hypothetical protein BDP27DRAFT_1322377 [Rhodocollybia butyracea]
MSGPQMFTGAHNLNIRGANFYNIGHDFVLQGQRETGLHDLYRHSSPSALLDAEARFPPPLCLPGTRETVLRDLNNWANSTDVDKPAVQWLYGAAGAGKSAIAQTFAERCVKNGTLIGSFFFWRSDAARNGPQQLFTTIALQIALGIPQLRSTIDAAVAANPLMLTSSIESQFDCFIIQPWLKAQMNAEFKSSPSPLRRGSQNNHSHFTSNTAFGETLRLGSVFSVKPCRILVIDGLDECSNSRDQQRILTVLAKAMQRPVSPTHILPFHILITSRPEPRIKESFKRTHFRNILQVMSLDNVEEASRDILRYLKQRFKEISIRHSHTMENTPRPWPTPSQINHLVQRASGQFIYASTVLKYIDDDGAVPEDRLNIIMGLQPEVSDPSDEWENPYADLDAVYRQILSSQRDRGFLLRILGILTTILPGRDPRASYDLGRYWRGAPRNDFLTGVLSVNQGTIRAALSGAHSLFVGSSPEESNFEFCHASFPDFLFDARRALQFFVDTPANHDVLAQYCVNVIIENSKTPAGKLSYKDRYAYDFAPHKISYKHQYAYDFWFYHCSRASLSPQLVSKLEMVNFYTFIDHKMQGLCWWDWGPVKLAAFFKEIISLRSRAEAIHNRQCLHNLNKICSSGFSLSLVFDKPTHMDGQPEYKDIPVVLSPNFYEGVDLTAHIRSKVKPFLPGYDSESFFPDSRLVAVPFLIHEISSLQLLRPNQ